MLTLYHTPISFNSRRVWIALKEKQLEFTAIPLKLNGDQFQADFLALNPFHHIPVLVDGTVTIIESLAILDYLEAKYPKPSLMPQNPEDIATVRMVEMVTVNELLPAMRPLIQKMMGFGTVNPSAIEESQQKIPIVLNFLEKCLSNRAFMGGDHLTLADIVAGTAVPLLPRFGISLQEYPKLDIWVQNLNLRESWQETQATEADIQAFKETMQKLMEKKV